jgi:hypothetical protein
VYFCISTVRTWALSAREGVSNRVVSGGGYILPARDDYFDMLASLQKEYDGAVGIAMLRYCACVCSSLRGDER